MILSHFFLTLMALFGMNKLAPQGNQSFGSCKVCARTPSTEPTPFKNPASCNVTATWVPSSANNGNSGECSDGGCNPRNCQWTGQIQVKNKTGSEIKVNITWGPTTLGGGTVTIPKGETRSVDLNKSLTCSSNLDSSTPAKVSFVEGNCITSLFLTFTCKKCKPIGTF